MDLSKFISKDVRFNGRFYETSINETISYPEDGNDSCFDIEDKSFWFQYRNEVIAEAVKRNKILTPIFDVGGGNGVVSSFLISRGFDSIVVEPGLRGCENCYKRGIKSVLNGTLESISVKCNSIASIGLFDVLEHIDDDKKFLVMLKRYLHSNGKIILTVPASGMLWSEDDVAAGHFRRYSRSELVALADECGYNVLEANYFFHILFPLIFVLRAMIYRFGMKKKVVSDRSSHAINSKAVNYIMFFEKILAKAHLPFGSSLLVVLEKKTDECI